MSINEFSFVCIITQRYHIFHCYFFLYRVAIFLYSLFRYVPNPLPLPYPLSCHIPNLNLPILFLSPVYRTLLAAAFTKGLLELEGNLTPILASLVTVEEKNKIMLDRHDNKDIKEAMDRCKDHLNLLQTDEDMTEEMVNRIAPGCSTAVRAAMLSLKNPYLMLRRMHELIGQLCEQIGTLIRQRDAEALAIAAAVAAAVTTTTVAVENVVVDGSNDSGVAVGGQLLIPEGISTDAVSTSSTLSSTDSKDGGEVVAGAGAGASSSKRVTNAIEGAAEGGLGERQLYLNETLSMMADRWSKLYKDFYSSDTGKFDLSKVVH